MKAPRPYQHTHDVDAMLQVLVKGRKASNGSYYIHSGDLKWWLYYPPLEGDYWEHIHLWDDPMEAGSLLGWALISPDWVGIDVYVQPELRGSVAAREMYVWAEEEARRIAREKGRMTIYAHWIAHDDHFLSDHFTERGFKLGRCTVHLRRSLEEPLPAFRLADGFALRGCTGEAEVARRAKAQFGAFRSSAAFEKYLQRFTNFMRSPVYEPDLDIVAVAEDGQVGAFCIVWPDPVNLVGLFEPVGTHPDFQRRGLGRAVMIEGMRRLQERGMKTAIVSTNEDNPAGIKLYESVGFSVINQLGTYQKDV